MLIFSSELDFWPYLKNSHDIFDPGPHRYICPFNENWYLNGPLHPCRFDIRATKMTAKNWSMVIKEDVLREKWTRSFECSQQVSTETLEESLKGMEENILRNFQISNRFEEICRLDGCWRTSCCASIETLTKWTLCIPKIMILWFVISCESPTTLRVASPQGQDLKHGVCGRLLKAERSCSFLVKV